MRRFVALGTIIVGAAACYAGFAAQPASTSSEGVEDAASEADASSSGVEDGTIDAAQSADGSDGSDGSTCLSAGDTKLRCPADWQATLADAYDFCRSRPEPYGYEVARTRTTCNGWLRYTQYLFEAGPAFCLYDPATGKLAAFAKIGGKFTFPGSGHETWTCGFNRDDFSQVQCDSLTCKDPLLATGSDDAGACISGIQRCNQSQPEQCDATGSWDGGTPCTTKCVKGVCTECSPGAKECVGNAPRFCDDSGKWIQLGGCAYACGGGVCGKSCNGTCACVNNLCAGDVIASSDNATQLEIDSANLYWSTSPPTGFGPGTIVKQPLGGGAAVELATTVSLTTQLAIDASYVYWADSAVVGATGNGAIKRVPINGGPTTTIATTPGQGPFGVAVNASGVFWSNPDGLMKSPLIGGASTLFASTSASRIVLDGTNIYWTDLRNTVNALMKMPLAGGSSTPITTVTFPRLAVDATTIYGIQNGSIISVPIGGGSATVLASNQLQPWSIAVDSTNVYWTNNWDKPSGALMIAPLTGGPAKIIVSNQSGASAVLVNGTHIYWIADNRIMRIEK